MLFARALLAFLALPGVVAFIVPLLVIDKGTSTLNPIALLPLLPGIAALVWCVRWFYAEGKGTLNPMYVAVALMLWGWAVLFRSRVHAVYAVAVMVLFHLRVVFGEEPWLARTHGDTWARYRAKVPR